MLRCRTVVSYVRDPPIAETAVLNHHRRVIARFAPLLILLAGSCAPVEREAAREDAPTAAQCAARGAFLDHRGMFDTAMCVTPFPDAGKVCSDKADCAGRCILDRDAAVGKSVGSEATGRCQADDALFGCHADVVGGKMMRTICED